MQILALSDIHQNLENLKELLKKAEKADLVVIAGDLTNYGEKEDALKVLRQFEGNKVFAVPGNLDTPEVVTVLEEKGFSINKNCAMHAGQKFCGFGGGLLGYAGSILYPESEIKKALEKMALEKSVLVTHLPPKKTKIDFVDGEHIGSFAVREAIIAKKPLLNICGHVHEAHGKIVLGETVCINTAAVKDGKASIIEINKKIKVRSISI